MKKIILICLIFLSFNLKAEEVKKEYYENGTLKSEITENTSKTYYKNGKLMAEEVLLENNGNVFNNKSLSKIYWPNGNLMAKIGTIGYKFTNPAKLYYVNGNLWIDWIHEEINDNDENLFTGIEKVYYRDKTLAEEVEFKNGKLLGKRTTYYPDGKIKTDGFFPSESEGYYKTFYKNGNLAEETVFSDGKFISGVRYDSSGQKTVLTDKDLNELNELYSFIDVRNKDTGTLSAWILALIETDNEKAQESGNRLLEADLDDGANPYVDPLTSMATIKNIYSK